jgi:hypothetical protein
MSPTLTATDALHHAAAPTPPLTPTKAGALLFGPDLYPYYVNWHVDVDDPEQEAHYPSRQAWRRVVQAVRDEDVGGMPSPQTFKAFMNTPRIKELLYSRNNEELPPQPDDEEQKNGTPDLLISHLCKHAIHPGNPCTTIHVCPICLMSQCRASLQRIAHVWRLVGGPYKPRRNENTGVVLMDPEDLMIYHAARKLWYAEKARWANLVHIFELYAMGERLWGEDSRQDGLEVPAAVETASTCVKALGIARESPFVGDGWEEKFVPAKYLREGGVGDEVEGSSVDGDGEAELPFSPPETPEMEAEKLRYLKGPCDGTEDSGNHTGLYIDGAHSISPPVAHGSDRPQSASTSPRSTTSPDSTICASSPPLPPPSSPPQTPSSQSIPSLPMIGVSFPDDLPSPSSRRSSYFQRTSPLYKQGIHASPSGSTWWDTSFMSDSKYDGIGIDEDEEEAREKLVKAQDKIPKEIPEKCKERFAGFTDVDLDSEDEGQESDWSDESDDGRGEDDLMTHLDRRTEGAKRLPGQVTGLSSRRPVFSFSWPKQLEAEDASATDIDITSGDFDDDEVEQGMREMDSGASCASNAPSTCADVPTVVSGGAGDVKAVSLVEPIRISSHRRSHDEFVGCQGIGEKDHVKRPCH